MGKIKQLSLHEAQKIAAGEVVERPANIVKELIENAIDAQATQISLYLHDGGKTLIRVVDNGSGMDADDAQICFLKHATSKIQHFNELETITSFGFRGEALASISAIAHITLITKEKESNEGIKIVISENSIKEKEPIGCSTGTDISIADLFYNVPARKKFLKKEQTEWRHIQQLFQAFCLNYPTIHFKLFSANNCIYNYPVTRETLSRGTQLWDQKTTQHLIAINNTQEQASIKINGFISNHHNFRYDRSAIFFFVNNRWIKNYGLNTALLKGYLNVIPQGRYPTACIQISIDPHEIDINIHPRKEEVLFMHPRRIEQLLQQTIKQALENNLSKQIKQKVEFASENPNNPTTQQINFNPFDFDQFFAQNNNQLQPHHIPAQKETVSPSPIEPNPSSQHQKYNVSNVSLATEPSQLMTTEKNYQLIGSYKKTYLLVEKKEGLVFVDQHAAQERILYELFSKRFHEVATINLIFPQIIPLSTQDVITIKPYLPIFHQNGIMIELFGTDQLIVKATPVHLKDKSLDHLVKDVINWANQQESLEGDEFFKAINEKLQAQMACKAAVKAGDTLTDEQKEELLSTLENTPNRFSCPHGRPTSWLLPLDEIEKKFRRRK
jgi:DNA mismatch repair protein MutL